MRYFSLQVPQKSDAESLIKCLECGVKLLGIDTILDKAKVLGVADNFPILVGCGTDGASVDIAEHRGMKGRMQKELP